jgi:hypothetical protein
MCMGRSLRLLRPDFRNGQIFLRIFCLFILLFWSVAILLTCSFRGIFTEISLSCCIVSRYEEDCPCTSTERAFVNLYPLIKIA